MGQLYWRAAVVSWHLSESNATAEFVLMQFLLLFIVLTVVSITTWFAYEKQKSGIKAK